MYSESPNSQKTIKHYPKQQGSAAHKSCLCSAWRSAGVVLPFWRSGVLVLAFCPLAFCPGVLPGHGVLVLAFWVPDFLDLGWAGVLAFWRSRFGVLPPLVFCSGVLPGVLGGWRSVGVLAFCLAFWRSLLGKGEGKG